MTVDVDRGFVVTVDVDRGFVGTVDRDRGFVGTVDVDRGFVGTVDVDRGFVGTVDVDRGFVGTVDRGTGIIKCFDFTNYKLTGAKVGSHRGVSMDDEPNHLHAQLDRVLIGGREPLTSVRIVDYDPTWPSRFGYEAARISVLGSIAKRIEHIGSTAVPGLGAKPIIDVLVAVDDVEDESLYRPTLEIAGYELRVREPNHLMFRTRMRDVHVHVWRAGSDEERRHLAFRDWLRVDRADRALYEQTKRELAQQTWPDMNYYAEAKGAVIAVIQARADAFVARRVKP